MTFRDGSQRMKCLAFQRDKVGVLRKCLLVTNAKLMCRVRVGCKMQWNEMVTHVKSGNDHVCERSL